MSNSNNGKIDDYAAALNQEFLDDCEDRLEGTCKALDEMAATDVQASLIKTVLQFVHSVKGLGGAFGFHAVSVIAHRMEDYMAGQSSFGAKDIKNLYGFIDAMRQVLGRAVQPENEEIAIIVRKLPVRISAEDSNFKELDAEALLVMPRGVQQSLIQNELQKFGFRVSSIGSSFHALEMAARTKPDIIILSALIDALEGIEVARMFHVMKITENTPVILITSFDENQMASDTMPPKTALVRKGKTFGEEIQQALRTFGLIASA